MRRAATPPAGGFTLIEGLLVIAVLGVVLVIAVPAVLQLIHRVKIEAIARETSLIMQSARFEAIKTGAPTVVGIHPASDEIVAFVDLHGETQSDASDGLFNPISGAIHRTTDFELARLRLPSGVTFASPSGTGLDSVDGFMNTGVPDPPDKQAIFLPDGSVSSAGAFRFTDQRGNSLEVRVDPPATAYIEVRKWDGSSWRAFGEGGEAWTWN